MAAKGGGGSATPPLVNSTFSSGPHFNIGHQATALPGAQWVLMARQTHPHHSGAHP